MNVRAVSKYCDITSTTLLLKVDFVLNCHQKILCVLRLFDFLTNPDKSMNNFYLLDSELLNLKSYRNSSFDFYKSSNVYYSILGYGNVELDYAYLGWFWRDWYRLGFDDICRDHWSKGWLITIRTLAILICTLLH